MSSAKHDWQPELIRGRRGENGPISLAPVHHEVVKKSLHTRTPGNNYLTITVKRKPAARTGEKGRRLAGMLRP